VDDGDDETGDGGMKRPTVAITMGDPCGVGPEIVVRALEDDTVRAACLPVVYGDRAAMERALALVGSGLELREVPPDGVPAPADGRSILLRRLSDLDPGDMDYGRPGSPAGEAVYRYITAAAADCRAGSMAAMVTAPINKQALNLAGHDYPGHTELLAELTGTTDFVMMLAGERLRVSLVTIHEPLTAVPGLVTFEKVLTTIRITGREMARHFRPAPRLAVAALNPHCGEGGLFGREEETVIAPAVAVARAEGLDVTGPLSADTLFHTAAAGRYDAVIAMYHDQGLVPLKLLHFDDGVNVTLGLPIIRTSVDHGTAYDIAGRGVAGAGSMIAAILMAVKMAVHRAGPC
jgi:4-hydroxythreonine-4-phosphate dehydrogenase